jgi:iron complex outermembrane recepter protein
MNSRTRLAAALVVAFAVLYPPFVFAQQTGEQTRRAIEEIVVTATKREESVQDVPLAVTALSGLQLERAGVQDFRDLPTLSASFNMNSSQTESQGSVFRIRGVGTTGNNIGLESAVGVFLDGVHLSRPGIALGDLVDVEVIEILRGPQGTLFGRNTSAGALIVRTRPPNLVQPEFWVNAGYGNFSALNAQAGGSVPLIEDRLAARGSVAVRRQDGFVSSFTGAESMDRDRVSLRGQLLWVVDDRSDLRIIADYADADEQCCDAPIIFESPIVPLGAFAATGLPANAGVALTGHEAVDRRRSNAEQFKNPFEQWGVSAEFRRNFEDVDLTYIGSWRDFSADSVQHSDFVGLDVFSVRPEVAGGQKTFDDIRTTTHELRFAGDMGRLQWMIGGFYMDEKIVEGQGLGLGQDFTRYTSGSAWFGGTLAAFSAALPGLAGIPLATGGVFGNVLTTNNPALVFAGGVDAAGSFAQNRFQQDTRAWSIFTHNTLAITDRLDVVLGLRWVDERKDGKFTQATAQNPACLNTLANAGALNAGAAGTGLEQAAGLIGAVAAGFMCFPFAAPADTGIPVLPATFDQRFEDDQLIWTVKGVYALNDVTTAYASFTHGFKAGGFNLDATAASGGADPRFESEKVDAWEIGLKTDLFDRRLRINTAVFRQELEDFQVLEFTGVQFVTFNVPKAESTGVEVELLAAPLDPLDLSVSVTYQDANYPNNCAPANAPPQVRSLCGGRLTNAADWTSVIGAAWSQQLGRTGLNWFLNTNVRWESKRRTGTQWRDPSSLAPAAEDFQDANAKVNLRLGLGEADGRWTVELWGQNIFDEQTRNVTFNIPLRGIGGFGTAARGAFIEAPRTYGMTLRVRM